MKKVIGIIDIVLVEVIVLERKRNEFCVVKKCVDFYNKDGYVLWMMVRERNND